MNNLPRWSIKVLCRWRHSPAPRQMYSYCAITPYLQVRKRFGAAFTHRGDLSTTLHGPGYDVCLAWLFWSVRVSYNSMS